MRVGILTHHYVKNFGAFMQAFALMSVINEMFPSAEIEFINLKVRKHECLTAKHFFGFKLKRGDTCIGYEKKIELFFTHLKYENSLPLSSRVYNGNDINKLNYDIIIVGSDEVWNFKDVAFAKEKFGEGIAAPMISYAASVGGSTAEDSIPESIIEGIKKFKAIAVRDSYTEKFVKKNYVVDVTRTLDPIYLYNYELTVSKKIKNLVDNNKYILLYDCILTDPQKKIIIEYAKKNKLNIIGAGEYRKWYTTTCSVNITPFEWAYLFKNAQKVITGTFHGTSFSIKYGRDFISVLTQKNRVHKVSSLLEEFGLSSRMVLDNDNIQMIEELLSQDINYKAVNLLLDRRIDESKTYLYNSIVEYGNNVRDVN